jgi:hypothetical protein
LYQSRRPVVKWRFEGTDEIINDTTHVVRDVFRFSSWIVGEHLEDWNFRCGKKFGLRERLDAKLRR